MASGGSRAAAYAQAASVGAPEALQVADRWHLLHNLRETLERLLGRMDAAGGRSLELSRAPVLRLAVLSTKDYTFSDFAAGEKR